MIFPDVHLELNPECLYDTNVITCNLQRLAVEGFLKGSSVVVCAPTSSGKTLIAECAAAASFAMQKRVFYTTPLKALSNQKFREFRYLVVQQAAMRIYLVGLYRFTV